VHFSMTPIEGEAKVNCWKRLEIIEQWLVRSKFNQAIIWWSNDTKYSVSQCGSDYLELNTRYVNFNLVTSENWINNDDIISSEFEAVLEEIDEED
jgi:hypothetical protein